MPAWPLGTTYTKGLLGIDQRDHRPRIAESRPRSNARSGHKRIETESFSRFRPTRKLMTIVRQTGRTLFGDNCAACHGLDAKGGKGFPNLTTGSWLWGGDPETIAETIRVGINSTHPNTRMAQMLAFGRDQMLPPADIDNVVAYVRTLSDPAAARQIPAGASSKPERRSLPPTARPATATTAKGRSTSARPI